jgi:hypothetical protein
LPKYEYCRYWKILENTGNTSIADTGRFWKILVIPVLQILAASYYPKCILEGEIRTTEGQSPKSPNLPKWLCLFDVIKSPRLLIGKDTFEFFFGTTA